MLEFLASFLLLLFSFSAAVNNDQGQPIALEKLQDNLSTTHFKTLFELGCYSLPKGFSNLSKCNLRGFEIGSTISITPAAELIVERLEDKEQKIIDEAHPLDSGDQEINENEVHEKAEAYNTQSEKVIGNVSSSGVDHSPVLVPCSENPELCNSTKPENIVSPTSIPTLIPIKPEPEPIITEPPKPIGPPEPINPPIVIPPPEKPPQDPCGCTPGKDIYCIMLYPCAESY